jgi:hypothetical protein
MSFQISLSLINDEETAKKRNILLDKLVTLKEVFGYLPIAAQNLFTRYR